ncbi:hypothetical protein PSCT_03024 [Pseudomonas sp. SCT]|uniref:hypothetical protein n=1 Tax=Pseudomonas sp. (strain SCT) TaxID=412955 RepID=UPI000ECA3B3E|nr:hypothetical protein [Pseudomonas sp. SCT]GCA56816.1 hypothetical protein PSCT_03024 [Pseudomonas sp. SCT]
MTTSENALRKLPRLFKIEGLSAVAVIFALFFTNGYVYLETLKNRLDIPINRLGFSSQIYAVYGGVSFLVIIAASLIALSAIMVATYIIALIENPESETSKDNFINKIINKAGQKLSKRHAKTKQFLLATLLTALLAALLYGLWDFTVSTAVKRAEKQAFKFATTCTESVISLTNTDRVKACIAGESDDVLYLLFKGDSTDKKAVYETGLLPKKNLEMTRKPSNIVDE